MKGPKIDRFYGFGLEPAINALEDLEHDLRSIAKHAQGKDKYVLLGIEAQLKKARQNLEKEFSKLVEGKKDV